MLLEIKNLKTYFFTGRKVIRAVDGVTLSVKRGGSLGIVGESGCGKSATALSILRLVPNPPGRIVGGEILLESEKCGGQVDLVAATEKQLRDIRGRRISMIFQEPQMALNPVLRVGDQIREAILSHKKMERREARERVMDLLQMVGIPSPRERYENYPHELSGGARQRVMIAMALALGPELLIADEPTTALDVTIQAGIIGLLTDLRERMGMALILITHDMGIIAETVNNVAVMYSGRIVEEAAFHEISSNPLHPYTIGLLGAIPPLVKMPKGARLATIGGMVPDLAIPQTGCLFKERCTRAQDDCRMIEPEIKEAVPGHFVRCHYYGR